MGDVVFSLANFPTDYCWPGPKQYGPDLIALLTGTVSGTNVIIGPDEPAVDQRGTPESPTAWIRTDAGGGVEGVYHFQTKWIRAHHYPPGSDVRLLYVGANNAGGLWSFDGGDGTDPAGATDMAGGMWAVDTDFAFRIPIGAGTNPTAYGGVQTTIAVGGTDGAEKVTLSTDQLPEHKHLEAMSVTTNDDDQELTATWENLQGYEPATQTNFELVQATGDPHPNRVHPYTDFAGQAVGDIDPVSVLPPVRGVYIIKRSARKYYAI